MGFGSSVPGLFVGVGPPLSFELPAKGEDTSSRAMINFEFIAGLFDSDDSCVEL